MSDVDHSLNTIPNTASDAPADHSEVGRKITFEDLRQADNARKSAYPQCESWPLPYWGNAIAGEVGELCNLIKKQVRDGNIDPQLMGKELADIVIYADHIAEKLGLSLGEAVVSKFNEVSDRIGSMVKLPMPSYHDIDAFYLDEEPAIV